MIISVVLVGGLSLLLLFCLLFYAIGYNGTRLSSRNLEAGFKTIIAYPVNIVIALTGLLVLGLGLVGAASAAEVVVKGQQLEGSVVGVTAKGVQFQTIYGEGGAIVIPRSDVEMIQSDEEFEVLYGEAGIIGGRIWGLEGDAILVGESPDKATPIPVDQIYRSVTREDYEKSRLEVLRARYRY
jgi:hypothetical protein